MKKLPYLFLAVSLAASDRSTVDAKSLRTVALSGKTAPDTNGAQFGSSLGAPVLNSVGQTAFVGNLIGAGVTGANNQGIWSERHGPLSLVVQSGSPAPGGGDYLGFVGPPTMNSFGRTAFIGFVTDTGGAAIGIAMWSDGEGPLSLVARTNTTAPGTDVDFTSLGYPSLNDAGEVAFYARIPDEPTPDGPAARTGLWSSAGGNLELSARDGEPAPGVAGATFSSVLLFPSHQRMWMTSPLLNSEGTSIFFSQLNGSMTPRFSLWEHDLSGTRALVLQGDAVPNIANATFFVPGGRSGVNDSSQV
ncbi:MAG: DUF7453 family protein, partial [Aeoliella sp.]